MLRSIPIRRIGNRETLFLGGDREIVMSVGLMSCILIFLGQSFMSALIGLLLWFAVLFICRKMAENDKRLRDVYLRHIRYKAYYPAYSTPFCADQRQGYR